MEQLLQQWGLEAIASGEQNFLMTQLHQLLGKGSTRQSQGTLHRLLPRRQAALPSQGESHLRVLVMLERLLTIVL